MNNYAQIKAIEKKNKERWLKLNPFLMEECGIYILTRVDENGVKFSYVGQAINILRRLAQHLTGYQHIDLSLKNHGLYDPKKKPYGWNVDFIICNQNELDEKERYFIKKYLEQGYQSRNKTLGGQDKGKTQLGDQDGTNGYYKGLKQGYANAMRDIKVFFDKYLDYSIKDKTNKIKERKYQEFTELLGKGEENV